MKYLIQKYWLVIRFILVFITGYTVLTLGYNYYLKASDGSKYYPDYMTRLVAEQSKEVLNALNYTTELENHPEESSIKVVINSKFVARIVEGCNSVSIIVLFISFVIAFSDTFKKTLLFILAGSVLIYAANLFRIVILSIGLYDYPWRRDTLHTVIFPLIIYSMVFLLWMVWVNHFTKIKKASESYL